MNIDFQGVKLFDGQSDPKTHIQHCVKQWQVAEVPPHLWVQVFLYFMGPIPKSWYIHEKTRRQTNHWKTLQDQFCKDFSFTSKYLELNTALQRVKEMLFTDISKNRSSPIVCVDHVQLLQSSLSSESDKIPIACCKVEKDLEKLDDLEELRNLTIKEMEGSIEI
jgi:hypothetical protein